MDGGKRFARKAGKILNIGSKAQVWHCTAIKTSGGLKRQHLMKTKNGRIVSKKQHANGKKLYAKMKAAGKLAAPFKTGHDPRRAKAIHAPRAKKLAAIPVKSLRNADGKKRKNRKGTKQIAMRPLVMGKSSIEKVGYLQKKYPHLFN